MRVIALASLGRLPIISPLVITIRRGWLFTLVQRPSSGERVDSRVDRAQSRKRLASCRRQAADLTFLLAAGGGITWLNARTLCGVGTILSAAFPRTKPGRCRASQFTDEGKGAPMTKGLVSSLLFLVGLALGGSEVRAAGLKQESGRLADLIATLASREYVLGEPARDDRPYVDPSPMLNAFRHVAAAMAWGDVKAAARQAAELDYEVVEFVDSETKKPYYVLREDLDAVETIRGWGSYIINPKSRVDALIEAPHPFADVHTPEIGGLVFAECEAKGFLLAGAHRTKADVPDLVDSVFHQVHTAWIGPSAHVAAWQIHGFASMKHAFPRGAQVVASTGDGEIAPEVAALDTVLEERGLTSYVFNELPAEAEENRELNGEVPGVTFTSLAAAKNEQGRLSRSLGGSFVHIELEVDVRANRESRQLAGSAIAAVIDSDAGQLASRRRSEVTLASAEIAVSDEAARGERASESHEEGAQVRVAAKPVREGRKAQVSEGLSP
jgi:hypothetical protein